MNTTNTTQDTIDLKQLYFSLLEQWKIILTCIVISLILTLLYLRVAPTEYSVDALVQVEDKKGASAALLGELSNVVEQESPAQAEIEIIRSRLVLGQVVNDLMLDLSITSAHSNFISKILHRPEPDIIYGKEGVSITNERTNLLIKKFNIPVFLKENNLNIQIDSNEYVIYDEKGDRVFNGQLNKVSSLNSLDGRWEVYISGQTNSKVELNILKMTLPSAINNIKENLDVKEVGKLTGILKLSYQGVNKTNAVKTLNTILQRYSSQNIERSGAETGETLKFLNTQLPVLRSDLDKAELVFNQFRKQYGTVNISEESNLYLNQVSTIQNQKIQLEQKRSELAAKYTDNHPVMKQIDAEITSLNQNIKDLNATLKTLPDIQRRYVQLQRDVELQTQLYNNLLNTYQQLRVANAGEIGNVRVIDQAVLPKAAIKPQKELILVVGLFLGVFTGMLIAVIRNLIHTGVKDPLLIETQIGLPVYATVPRSAHQENRPWRIKKSKYLPILSHFYTDDPTVESLRSLRTTLHFSMKDAANNRILITGPSPEIGKSFIAVNLATVMAQSGKKILLVDADLRRGYLHKYFKLNNTKGISSLLTSPVQEQSVIFQSEIQGLDFLARGPAPKAPSELLGSDDFKHYIEKISVEYDYVIIDTAPMLAVTDALVVAELAATCLLVARYSMTSMKELELSLQRFQQSGIKVNGLVLNDIERKVGYGYGNYGYGYNYSYKGND